ncbi:MAG TPA: hypothetical protein VE959_26415 [Bryobacteraceae bacterium]|nr:hypothetical protein [Bryobacteraceae bacterium]
MKSIAVLFLCAAAMFAQAANPTGPTAGFTTGQAARLVIGQSTFTSDDPNSSDTLIGAASGLAYAADTLFVADANRVGAAPSNHRVLLYQGLSSMLPSPTSELTYNRKCPACVGQATVVLGQPDFTTTTENIPATQNDLRLPTAVASDGVHLVVADTNHNRVLIWNRIPSVNNQPADVVVGQPDFGGSNPSANTPTSKTMRGPQGVWIQNGKLYVADTQNNRVLVYNSIPTSNGVAADLVLGAPDFTTFVQPDLTQQTTSATAQNMLNPVSVTSDGLRLFVTDLGYNRVLVWNTIPTSNDAAADVAIGQPDLVSSAPNNAFTIPDTTTGIESPVLCTVSNGVDTNGNTTYPTVCNSTLNFPRFALAGGGRLFVADGGNDRVLVFEHIPTTNGAAADEIIGQLGGTVNQATDAADSLRTPMSLAWDGVNLYVSDAYNLRITVYSPSPTALPYQAVRNAAAPVVVATGQVTIGGNIYAGDIVTIEIGYGTATTAPVTTTTTTTTTASGTTSTCTQAATATASPLPAANGSCIDYTYTVKTDDTILTVVQGLVDSITNAFSGQGDPNVIVTADTSTNQVVLTARVPGPDANNITYSATVSSSAQITATAAAGNLSGGGGAAKVAPGTIVVILAAEGTTIAAQSASADPNATQLPTRLGGVEVYFNGIPAPLYSVTPTQITAQVPWEVNDTTSINAYVRSVMADGSIVSTTPVAVTIVPANPAVFGQPGTNPTLGMVMHASSQALGIIDVEGTVTASDTVTATIQDRAYNYTVQSGDTLETVRDALIALINTDPLVSAEPSGEYTRIVVKARIEGPEGNNIPYATSASTGATEIMTAFTAQLCCANVANALVTSDNPAIPGEFIIVYATGLGLPNLTDQNKAFVTTGLAYPAGAPVTTPASAVSSLAGGKTADVISATLLEGSVGTFKVILHLNADMPTDPLTTLTIAQDVYVSPTVRFPLANLSGQ